MGLTRVVIKPDIPDGAPMIEVMAFNPNLYQVDRQVKWKAQETRSLDLDHMQYDGGGEVGLSFSLVFDSYERIGDRDVRQLSGKIVALAEVPEGKDRPPICQITWGMGLSFKGVLESVAQKFTLFLEDGTPVRATLDLKFKGYEDPLRQSKENPHGTQSPLQARLRVARQGDALWSLAAAEYGSPAKWRLLARANQLVNPRQVEPGRQLLIPILE
jgi:phage protein U